MALVALVAVIGCADGNKKSATRQTAQPVAAAAGEDARPASPDDQPATPDEIRAMIDKQVNPPASSGEPQIPVAGTGGPGKATPGDPRLGKLVTISGTAANAFLGAVVVDADGGTYYVEGLAEWDDDLLDQRVEVAGTLRRKKLAPDPVVGPNGEVSHGMKGMAAVLEAPTWKPAG